MTTLRMLRMEDAEEFVRVRRLALDSDPDAFGARADTDSASQLPFVRERLSESSIEGGAFVLGAFAPDLVSIVGVNRTSPSSARIWGLYVVPLARQQGIGHAILQQTLVAARTMAGIRTIELSVSESSAAAIALYDDIGFGTTGKAEGGLKRTMAMDLLPRSRCPS